MTLHVTKICAATILFLGMTLAACDAPADDKSAADLPAATSSSEPESVSADSSMGEDSPAGEGVTAEEIPHSDVPPPSREVFTDADCDFEEWMGKKVDEAAIKETGRPSRIMAPGSMMTMDHNPQRINVEHDKDMNVTRVWCG